jgi:hypothetical protein
MLHQKRGIGYLFSSLQSGRKEEEDAPSIWINRGDIVDPDGGWKWVPGGDSENPFDPYGDNDPGPGSGLPIGGGPGPRGLGASTGAGSRGPSANDPSSYSSRPTLLSGKFGREIEYNPDPEVRNAGLDVFQMLSWIFENKAKLEQCWNDVTKYLKRNGGKLKEGLQRLRNILNLAILMYERLASLLDKPIHKAVKRYFAIDAAITAWEILYKGGPFELTPADVLELIPGWFGVLFAALSDLPAGEAITQKYLSTKFKTYMEDGLRAICKTMQRFKDWSDDEINKFLGPLINDMFKALYGGLPPG